MKSVCDKCRRSVIRARLASGSIVDLEPTPVLTYWLEKADCGTVAHRADDVKYFQMHRCGAKKPHRDEAAATSRDGPDRSRAPEKVRARHSAYRRARLAGKTRREALLAAGYTVGSADSASIRGNRLDRILGIGLTLG